MLKPLQDHDAHYWRYLNNTGRSQFSGELEQRAYWGRNTPVVQQRLIKHGYAPAFVKRELGLNHG